MKDQTCINRFTTLLVLLTVSLFSATNIHSAPGNLDPTFGIGGIVVNAGPTSYDKALGMAIQADGKVVVVGENGASFVVVRFKANGALDGSFGNQGMVVTEVSKHASYASSVAIQTDGKIVVFGSSYPSSFAVVRYHPNGSLDTSFNGTGIVLTSLGGSAGYLGSVAIQTDGKIVATATRDDGISKRIAVFRYNTEGSLDPTFNSTGIVITTIGNFDCEANSLAIQADGKIVVVGVGIIGFPIRGFAVVRYNTNGSLDTLFGGTGIVTTQVGNLKDEAFSVTIQTDGKIVVVGRSESTLSTSGFAFVRYNPNGSLDNSFSGTGKVVIPVGNSVDRATSAAIQADGKIVAGGWASYAHSSAFAVDSTAFAVVRLNPNGSLDTTFNGTGKVVTRISGNYDEAYAVGIQGDGKIVVAGGVDYVVDHHHITVVRYQGGSNANIRTGFDFDGDGRADISVFRPSDRNWYLNRSSAGLSATQFGLSTDKITPADFDGDGKTDIAVFRDGVWYWLNSSNGSFNLIQFGLSSDLPVPADFTGDGRAELAVYRGGIWWWLDLSNNQVGSVQFGLVNDKPVVADYDGDGRADQAVYRDGVWHLNRSSLGYTAIQFGLSTDKPVPADNDGDGKTDLAVYRDGTWYLQQSSNGFTAFNFGLSSDLPVPADYDGDGKCDAAVYRDGTWYLLQSTGGFSATQFGLAKDQPVPAASVR